MRYLRSIRDHWLLVIAIVGAALLAAVIYVSTAQKRYTAHAQIVVTPLPADDTTFLGIGGLIRDSTQAQPVVTAAQLLGAPQVRARTEQQLRSPSNVSFAVTPLGQSNVVDLQATSSTPQGAETAANVYAETALRLRKAALQNELAAAISRLQSRLAVTGGAHGNGASSALDAQITQQLAQLNALVGSPDPTLALLNRAAKPSSYSWPRPKLSLLVALLCGLLLGALVAILLDCFDPVAKGAGDLRERDGPQTLVRVPEIRERQLRRYATGALSMESRYRDAFRRLRSVLIGPGAMMMPPSVVAICSTDGDEGRTSTTVGLARALADADKRVVIVDGDMRTAGATSMLIGSPAGAVLSDVLRKPAALPVALVSLAPNLSLVPAIADPDGPDLIASERLERLFDALRADFDIVVIDAAPFDDGPDGYAFAEAARAVLVCARLGHTSRRAVRETVRRLASMRVAAVGIVAVGGKDGYGSGNGWWSRGEAREDRPVTIQESVPSLVPSGVGRDGGLDDEPAAF